MMQTLSILRVERAKQAFTRHMSTGEPLGVSDAVIIEQVLGRLVELARIAKTEQR